MNAVSPGGRRACLVSARRVGDRHGTKGVDTIRHVVEPFGGDDRVLCGGALAARMPEAVAPHAVTDRESGSAWPSDSNGAGEVATDHERECDRGTEGAGAHERVHRVDRDPSTGTSTSVGPGRGTGSSP